MEIEKELMELVGKFLFDITMVKSQFLNDQHILKNTHQKKLLIDTITFYSNKKKEMLNEDFEIQKILELNRKQTNDEYEIPEDNSNLSSTDTNDNISDTESEYMYSDADENDTQMVDKMMTLSKILLRRARQSKVGLFIKKKIEYNI